MSQLHSPDINNNSHPVNTFSRRPSLQQVFSYMAITLQTLVFYLVVYPNIPHSLASTLLYSVSLVAVVVSTFISSYIDPSDPHLI